MAYQVLVAGDQIQGTCPGHQVPAPSGTAPAGPLPFLAPLSPGSCVSTVLVRGKPAAVLGSFGYNTPPHPGIVDPPFATPTMQVGRIVSGSPSVLIGGKPAATVGSRATCCATPASAVGPGDYAVLAG
jgi:uncharacterized Zn-binding protein involved in type VI secretion